MKTITFKTLSILLAAVLLVAALPIAAFADDVSRIIIDHSHIYEDQSSIFGLDGCHNYPHRVLQ